jgi:putative endonuclease
MTADATGRQAEAIAARYLTERGWTILAERVRTKAGEVDLVARRESLVAFVEVKARATAAALDLALDERRLARVAAAAEALIPRFAGAGEDVRIDAILIAPGRAPRHLKNVWLG